MASASAAEVLVILDNLKRLAAQNVNLFPHEDQLRNLCDRLENLLQLLPPDEVYREKMLISSIREVAHEAEDAIESPVVRELNRKTSRNLLRRCLQAVKFEGGIRDLYKQLREARRKVEEIYQRFDFPRPSTSKRDQRWIDKPLSVGDDNMVGCGDQVKRITDLLTSGSDNLEVISITGMVGLGKTTLARKVLNDPAVECRFPFRAFVSLPRADEIKEVFRRLLRACSLFYRQMERPELPEHEVIGRLHDYWKRETFFIVLDDVWSTEAWDYIKGAFTWGTKMHSRVLITTENKSVAHVACKRVENQHDMRFLHLEESQDLFRREVFGDNNCPMELAEYESKILEKCDGLPLAIISFARILAKRGNKIDWWKRVAGGVNIFKEESQINKVIRQSFNRLRNHLKLCFLYLGVFREDFEIPVRILLRLWMAEGLIKDDSDVPLEDVAEDHLEELVDRNLVMVARRRSNGRTKTCRIHGIFLDFCKAEAKEENIFQESILSENCRRVCIHSYVTDQPMPKDNPLRSLLCFSDITGLSEQISSILRTFKLLRVLDVRPCKFTRLPVELLSLVLLRYIAISFDFGELREELSNLCNLQTLIIQTTSGTLEIKADLCNLQTLIIQTTSGTLEIKADISKMASLRHLHINKPAILQKSKGESSVNENLLTLTKISPESCTKELFQKTPKVKKLGISGKFATFVQGSTEPNLFECLLELDHLENLKLLNEETTCKLHALPSEHSFPRKLTSLTLVNTFLDWENMSILGKLENLEILKLKDNAFEGELWQTVGGGFRRLKILHIGRTNLLRWKGLGSDFPSLTSLFLRHCTNLKALPLGIGCMPCLETVDIYCSHPELAPSARKVLQPKLERQPGFKLSVYPPDQ